MMQDNSGADNSASARKALARAQRVLQIAAVKRSGLALRDVREVLEECLRTEASTTMKVLGYRIASRSPTCMTLDTWAFVLDACVMELAGSQNAPVLQVALPVLELVPMPLMLGFLVSTEKEPANKLRAVLTHEDVDVRCCAIASLSRLTIEVASSITNGGLMVFPFESHEARVCCQQDTWSLVIDVWKAIFQTLLLTEPATKDAVGAAFFAMRTLFARTSVMAPFFTLAKTHPRNLAAMNDITSAMFKEAFPRARSLVTAARKLSMKHQAPATLWIAMLLFMMMERTGARCPSISVPYLELDIDLPEADENDDDDDDGASTERVRIDEFARDLLRSWLLPLLTRKATLLQNASVCRAMFILLSHPLQRHAQMQHSLMLVNHLIAQCWFIKNSATKLEFARMLVQAFGWLSSAGCVTWFTRTVDTIFLIDREGERSDLLQWLIGSVLERVHRHRDFELFESICAVEVLSPPHATSAKVVQSTVASEVFRAITQAIVDCGGNTPAEAKQNLLLTQLIALKIFKAALTPKPPSTSEDPIELINRRTMLRCYMTLLTAHFLNSSVGTSCAFIESLEFFRKEVLKIWRQIPSLRARLQLLSIGLHLAQLYQVVPVQVVMDAVKFEVLATFVKESRVDEEGQSQVSGASSSAFDDGRLGSGSAMCGAVVDLISEEDQALWVGADALMAVNECLKCMARISSPASAPLDEIYQQLRQYVVNNCSVTQVCHQLLDHGTITDKSDASVGFFSQEIMNPFAKFLPLSRQPLTSPVKERYREPQLVTGSGDPFAIQLSYYQPLDTSLDVIVLEIMCCNLTSLSLNDFELRICPVGGIAKCIDTTSDMSVRVLSAGGAVSSTLLPFGTIKAEKRFQITKFGQASFSVRVVFSDSESSEQTEQEQQPVDQGPSHLALSDKFVVRFDALCSSPQSPSVTASFFQAQWQSAESAIQLSIQSRDAATHSLSLCQQILQRLNPRVSVIAELLIDLPFYSHVVLLTKTRWDDYITVSISLYMKAEGPLSVNDVLASSSTPNAQKWAGVLELRSSTANTRELAKIPSDVLRVFTGGLICAAPTKKVSVMSGPEPSYQAMATPKANTAEDPYANAKSPFTVDTSPFNADFTVSETRSPQAVQFDQNDWLQPPASAPVTTVSTDPWL